MISATSRYADSTLVFVDDPKNGQSRQVIVPSSPQPYSFSFVFHIVTGEESERPDILAQNYYGNAQLWWVIADGNPEVMDWTSVPVGTVVRIPSI